jgi:glycosyltransferase involved in cell wall biosynthesis
VNSRICAIVPALNCSESIGDVISKARAYLPMVLTIDDGSTDETASVASNAGATVFRHDVNQGKGMALRSGFRIALQKGYNHAVTLDGDGQHDPSDVPALLEAGERFPGAVILGARDMENSNVPIASRVGNWVANFFVNLSARQRLPDTQCGFRLYPLESIDQLPLQGRGYELESEVIVRASRRQIRFHAVPISTHYPPGQKRTTHFHLFRDTLQIFWCVLRSFFWR